MKSSSRMIVAAALATLLIAACNKPPEPSTPTSPDPKAQAPAADEGPGKTTNFENPAPAESK
jgi:hypothetical protein